MTPEQYHETAEKLVEYSKRIRESEKLTDAQYLLASHLAQNLIVHIVAGVAEDLSHVLKNECAATGKSLSSEECQQEAQSVLAVSRSALAIALWSLDATRSNQDDVDRVAALLNSWKPFKREC